MAELFGSVEALNAVLILTGTGSDKFKSSLEAMRNATGATEAAYSKMVDNFGKANQNLTNNLQVTLVEVGEPLLAQYGKTAQALVLMCLCRVPSRTATSERPASGVSPERSRSKLVISRAANGFTCFDGPY